MTYLQQMNNLINQLGNAGIYTLVDAHQDVFSPKICGEGVPNFYAQNLSDKCTDFGPIFEDLGQCTPLSKYNFTYDSNGDPVIADCLKNYFPVYYTSPEAQDAFSRLYQNKNGLQDKFLAFWSLVSQFFLNNPYVLGYDPLNEPCAADVYDNPTYAYPGVFDREVLQFLWQNVSRAVRQQDRNKIIFFEPVQTDLIPKFGGIVFNVGFNMTPGGPEYNNAQVLNEHTYCCQADSQMCIDNNGEPPLSAAKRCAYFHEERLKLRSEDAARLGVGLMITEFGSCSDSLACMAELNSVTTACDNYLVGWAYWMFKGFGDYTSTSTTIEGLYDGQGNLQTLKLKTLSKTYVQYYQGTPSYTKFDPNTGKYVTIFKVSNSVKAPTVLFLNQALWYPNGFDLNIINSADMKPVVSTNGNYVTILYTNPSISTTTISVTAK